MDLSKEHWNKLTLTEQENLAKELNRLLPNGFEFVGIKVCRSGNLTNQLAYFRLGNSEFAFLPAAVVTLGYDASNPWQPNPEELESWRFTASEYFADDSSLSDYLAEFLLPARQVNLGPLLVETAAAELGWTSIEPDDPEVKQILRHHGEHRLHVQQSVSLRIGCRDRKSTRRGWRLHDLWWSWLSGWLAAVGHGIFSQRPVRCRSAY